MSPELREETLSLTHAYLNGSWDEAQRDRLEVLMKAVEVAGKACEKQQAKGVEEAKRLRAVRGVAL